MAHDDEAVRHLERHLSEPFGLRRREPKPAPWLGESAPGTVRKNPETADY
jgi:hypothetical protein